MIEHAPTDGAGPDEERRSPDWDIRTGSGNLATLLITSVAGTGSAFVATWLVIRMIGAAGYGRLTAVLIAAQFISYVGIEWTAVSLSRFGCEEFVESGQVRRTFWTRFALLVCMLLVVIAASPWLFATVGSWLLIASGLWPLILTYLVVSAISSHMQRTLQAAKLPRMQGAVVVLERVVLLISVGVLWAFGGVSLLRVVLCYVCAPILPIILGAWRLRRLIGHPTFDRTLLRQLLVFSLPLAPSSWMASLSALQVDAFFVTRYLSALGLGVYALANQIAGVLTIVPTHVGSLLLSFLVTSRVRSHDQFIRYYFSEILPPMILGWSLLCVMCAAVGGYAIQILFGPQFDAAAAVLWPLAAAGALNGPVAMGYGQISNARSQTYMSTATFGISAVLNISMDLLLIPRFGLLGCAWATLIAAFGNLLGWLYFARAFADMGVRRRAVVVALMPIVVAVGLAATTTGVFVPFIAALLAGLALAVPYVRTLPESIEHASRIGLPIPPWMFRLALKPRTV